MQEEKFNNQAPEKAENNENEQPAENTSNEAQQDNTAQEAQQEENLFEKIQVELTEAKDKYIRLYSEFENYKRRTQKERIDLIKTAGVEVILSVLPVLDDFERAIKSNEIATDVSAVKDGVNLIFNKFRGVLEQKGLKPMECIGKEFDADLHDAITNIPAPTEELKGKVIEDVQKGYYLGDKVVRHAKVVVGS